MNAKAEINIGAVRFALTADASPVELNNTTWMLLGVSESLLRVLAGHGAEVDEREGQDVACAALLMVQVARELVVAALPGGTSPGTEGFQGGAA